MDPSTPDYRFECTGCGQCCTGDPQQHYVQLSRAEQRRLASFLGISKRQLEQEYLEVAPDESEGIALLANGKCPFLDDRGRCQVYPVRPDQCATYPFWPEILHRPDGWAEERHRCEGIDRGQAMDPTEIQRRLKLMQGR